MLKWRQGITAIVSAGMLFLQACNLPAASRATPNVAATVVALTLSALPTAAVLPPPPIENAATPLPTATETSTPTFTPTPQNPLVLKTSLCWAGPGPVYEVVSALKQGERVELLGQGSIAGWWIVKNPIYKDPCWVQAVDLQLDPAMNATNLKIYYPPPTPTFTSAPTATNTPP
ncbi:MAG: hypothetical protein Fur0043_09690 [Anaerolineales bacterium]